MALTKKTYTSNTTVIPADNLNAIQDEIINKCNTVESKSFTAAEKTQARANIGAVAGLVKVSISSFSSLPQTVSNSSITAKHEVVSWVVGTPSAQTGDWTWTTAAGSVTISGNISGSTTLTLWLAEGQ